jgi:hypothetical protein
MHAISAKLLILVEPVRNEGVLHNVIHECLSLAKLFQMRIMHRQNLNEWHPSLMIMKPNLSNLEQPYLFALWLKHR